MAFRLKKLILVGLLINLVILFVNFFIFKKFEIFFNDRQLKPDGPTESNCDIELWSKASIGDYLWEHILRATIQRTVGNGYYRFGKKTDQNLVFRFRSGYSITPTVLGEFVSEKLSKLNKVNLILVLNGRTKANVQTSEAYLNQLYPFKEAGLQLGVVLLGNENCFNGWIKPHLQSNGGHVRFLFVVYDWQQVDNVNVFQWPLGVATYRNFSLVQIDKHLIKDERRYLCNYLATVYKQSSREELLQLIESSWFKERCHVAVRFEWLPKETNQSLHDYESALRNSDLTLSPNGMNHECYRIYEALSYLSVPVLEENLAHVAGKRSNCDQQSSYRLLKEFDAPVKFVANWTNDLGRILEDELKLSSEERLNRRIRLFNWYEKFKSSMSSRLAEVAKKKFGC